MADSGAGRPAARAIVPPPDPSHSNISGARLAAPRSEPLPASAAHPNDSDWMHLATAPTLLLTPTDRGDDDTASTSRIATAPPMAVEHQPWFRTGTTVAPPSMRPMGESRAPAPLRDLPNPRVLKLVAGVLAVCVFIVAVAGLKIVYKRLHAPAAAPTLAEGSTLVAPPVTADLARAAPSPPVGTAIAELPRMTPEPAVPIAAPIAPATKADAHRTPSVRTSPPRTTTKTTTRRSPAPKKTGRGTH
jgi:hypothetical protein